MPTIYIVTTIISPVGILILTHILITTKNIKNAVNVFQFYYIEITGILFFGEFH